MDTLPDPHPSPDRHRPLTREEIALARELLESYRAARATGRAAKWLLVTLAVVAAGITAWESIVGRLRSWLAP